MKENPETPEDRKALHQALLAYATTASRDGTTKGLARFVSSYRDQNFIAQLVMWLEKYTPIRRQVHRLDDMVLCVPKSLRADYDLAGARLNPYYSMEPVVAAKNVLIVHPESGSHHQLSDREFKKKTLRLALNTFLDQGTVESKRHLVQLINEFPLKDETARRTSPFPQAGAPGLGKRH